MATSKLQRYVSKQLSIYFGHCTIRENHRPRWLSTGNGGNLELDFFIEELSVAIEVQGIQHYMYVPFFHGSYNGFLNRIKADNHKRKVCKNSGIAFFEVASESDFWEFMDKMRGSFQEETKKEVYTYLGDRRRKEVAAQRKSRSIIRRLIKKAERQLAEMEQQPNNKTIEPGYIKTIERIAYHLENGSFNNMQREQHFSRVRSLF